jgi:hypothetical protein
VKIKGFTESQDWNWRTLLWMLRRPECWDGGVTWREWGVGFDYTWYDGPIFQLRVGPFWFGLITA